MVVLIDLDGTLTDTAHEQFKPFKDGIQEVDLTNVPLIHGATEFIEVLKAKGHTPIIISDSHPRYVNKIAEAIFHIPAVSLTDKPNIEITMNYLQSVESISNLLIVRDNFIVIGDSWLDIELGRRLNIRTVLTKFYKQ